jgi:hypothetical protein
MAQAMRQALDMPGHPCWTVERSEQRSQDDPMPMPTVHAERVAIVFGFGLTIIGLFLTQFYLEPVLRQRSDLQQALGGARTKATILAAANAMDNIFGQLGSLVFTLNSNDITDETSATVVRTLQLRALDWRHDGVRTYIAQLGIAGDVDYHATASAYEALVADEKRLGTIAAYRKANSFEADLTSKALKDGGAAAMSAIRLHSDIEAADGIVQQRQLILLIVTLVGSTCIVWATLMATSVKPHESNPPVIGSDTDLAPIIVGLKAALADIRSRTGAPGDDRLS